MEKFVVNELIYCKRICSLKSSSSTEVAHTVFCCLAVLLSSESCSAEISCATLPPNGFGGKKYKAWFCGTICFNIMSTNKFPGPWPMAHEDRIQILVFASFGTWILDSRLDPCFWFFLEDLIPRSELYSFIPFVRRDEMNEFEEEANLGWTKKVLKRVSGFWATWATVVPNLFATEGFWYCILSLVLKSPSEIVGLARSHFPISEVAFQEGTENIG